MPFIEKTYRAKTEKRYRAVAGLSMGGDGTFTYALHHPELFAAACPLSAGTGPISLDSARARLKRENNSLTDSSITAFYQRQSVVDEIPRVGRLDHLPVAQTDIVHLQEYPKS